jgi:hypothetical protein
VGRRLRSHSAAQPSAPTTWSTSKSHGGSTGAAIRRDAVNSPNSTASAKIAVSTIQSRLLRRRPVRVLSIVIRSLRSARRSSARRDTNGGEPGTSGGVPAHRCPIRAGGARS